MYDKGRGCEEVSLERVAHVLEICFGAGGGGTCIMHCWVRGLDFFVPCSTCKGFDVIREGFPSVACFGKGYLWGCVGVSI